MVPYTKPGMHSTFVVSLTSFYLYSSAGTKFGTNQTSILIFLLDYFEVSLSFGAHNVLIVNLPQLRKGPFKFAGRVGSINSLQKESLATRLKLSRDHY